MPKCSIGRCDSPVRMRGFCHKHYLRISKYGDPNQSWIRTPIQRFEDKYHPEPNSGCWIWLGALFPKGYGMIRWNKKVTPAHIVSYKLFRGPIPFGLQIDHLCRVRCCVNPYHLETVTGKENVRRGLCAEVAYRRGKERGGLAKKKEFGVKL